MSREAHEWPEKRCVFSGERSQSRQIDFWCVSGQPQPHPAKLNIVHGGRFQNFGTPSSGDNFHLMTALLLLYLIKWPLVCFRESCD
jgi:hypothetical protein